MLAIAICDDTPHEAEHLRSCLGASLRARNIEATLLVFSSGEELLAHMQAGGVIPICFLDIYMHELSGVDVARWIRQQDDTAAIVFVTTSSGHMAQGWEVGAAHYLLKPYDEAAVDEALGRCLRMTGYREKHIELLINRQPQRLLLSNIAYIESQNKHCVIHMQGGETPRVLMRLDEMEATLNDARFLRCHQSYIVNMDFVQSVREGNFILAGAVVPMRRNERLALVRQYEDYCIDAVRRRV